MKKLLKFVLVLAMCATMMSMTVFAAGSGSMAVESKTAQAGQTVSVDVSITGNPGVAALVIVPEYDPSVLTLDSITGSGLEWTTGKAASWSDAANTTYTGKILTLNFTVNENVTHGTTTSVSVTVDAANYDEELVSFSVSAGTVTIECNHVYDQGSIITAATCDKDGVKTYTCTRGCGHSYTESIPATGHAYGEWSVTKEATCTEAGTESRVCANDNAHVETRDIAAKGHTEKRVNPVLATCSKEGYTSYVICSVCGTTIKAGTVIPKTAHNYKWVIDKEATTDGTGLKHEECAECGAKRNEGTVIPKKEVETGHTHIYGGLDMDETYHWTYCACGAIGSKGVHNFVESGTAGVLRCADCGYETAKNAGNVATSDSSNLALWVGVLAVAAGVSAATVYGRKKRM